MKRLGLIVTVSAVVGAVPASASQCAGRPEVLAALADRHAESRQAVGLSATGLVVEVFASATGSWTITATRPDGVTCIVAAGQGFELLAEGMGVPG